MSCRVQSHASCHGSRRCQAHPCGDARSRRSDRDGRARPVRGPRSFLGVGARVAPALSRGRAAGTREPGRRCRSGPSSCSSACTRATPAPLPLRRGGPREGKTRCAPRSRRCIAAAMHREASLRGCLDRRCTAHGGAQPQMHPRGVHRETSPAGDVSAAETPRPLRGTTAPMLRRARVGTSCGRHRPRCASRSQPAMRDRPTRARVSVRCVLWLRGGR